MKTSKYNTLAEYRASDPEACDKEIEIAFDKAIDKVGEKVAKEALCGVLK